MSSKRLPSAVRPKLPLPAVRLGTRDEQGQSADVVALLLCSQDSWARRLLQPRWPSLVLLGPRWKAAGSLPNRTTCQWPHCTYDPHRELKRESRDAAQIEAQPLLKIIRLKHSMPRRQKLQPRSQAGPSSAPGPPP